MRASSRTLLRQLGLASAIALVISNMVGTGIFSSTGFLASDLGSPILILQIWVAGALCALAGALCYSELGVNFPSSGGEYVYLTHAYGPVAGFADGWVSFFAGFSAPIAAASLAAVDYLSYLWPTLAGAPWITLGPPDWQIALGPAQLAASVMIAMLHGINCLGVAQVARLQNTLTAIKVIGLALFVIVGLTSGSGNWANLHATIPRVSTNPLAAQFAISLFFIVAGYSGWNAATYVAEELDQPTRTLPLALAAGTAIVAALYLGLNITYLYGVPVAKLAGVVAVGTMTSKALFGPGAAGLFSAFAAVALLGTVNAMATVGPRVYYAMARNGAFFPQAAQVSPRFRTPVFAILSQAVCSILFTLTPLAGLFAYIGFTLNFAAVMAVVSLFRFRRRPEWRCLPAVSFLYPLVPVSFVLVGVWITICGVLLRPVVSLAAVLTIAAGAACYQALHRRAQA